MRQRPWGAFGQPGERAECFEPRPHADNQSEVVDPLEAGSAIEKRQHLEKRQQLLRIGDDCRHNARVLQQPFDGCTDALEKGHQRDECIDANQRYRPRVLIGSLPNPSASRAR